MSEQITEEFANELLKNIYGNWDGTVNKKEIFKTWKKQGYIKQSREEEIREELKQLVPKVIIDSRDVICDVDYDTWKAYELQKELIEILDKKLPT